MFEFSSRLKTISYVLILIGAISVGFSFLAGGDHHDEGHDEHATAMHDEHADASHDEHAAHADEHADHHADHAVAHHGGHSDMPETSDFTYHKSASRAIPSNNHFYTSPDHHDAEHMHHQMENKPWSNLLVNSFWALALGLGALFFMAVQYAAQVGWSVVILRILEAMTSFIWVPGLVILIIILTGWFHFGGNHVYHWMADGIMDPANVDMYDPIIAGKQAYLNGPFFTLRALIYLGGWIGAAMMFRKMSLNSDQPGVDYHQNWVKMRNLGAGFLVFFAVTSSTSAWDWIMSIDTHWFSTLFGWYVFATMFVSALTALMMIILYLKGKGYLAEVNKSHIQDVAKFMFAFSIFWTYLWFSQFMLIWYSNIPEEVTYYMARFGEYKGLFFTMLVMNFVFPILVLMSRDSKRNHGFIFTAGIVILFGHWLDIFIMIMPGTVGSQWSVGLVQIGTMLGFVGLFILTVFRTLSKAPLMPKNHPMYVESTHFHQ